MVFFIIRNFLAYSCFFPISHSPKQKRKIFLNDENNAVDDKPRECRWTERGKRHQEEQDESDALGPS
jgi:hypothetical protein